MNEALFFGDRLSGSLLNPNQLHANGLIVNDVPRQFDARSTHSIHAVTKDGEKIAIPLTL